jgi:hypothetical protein
MYPKVWYMRDSVTKLFPVIEHRKMVGEWKISAISEADSSGEISKERDSDLDKNKVWTCNLLTEEKFDIADAQMEAREAQKAI